MAIILPKLSARPKDAHKGHFGRVQIIGGSTGMAGAPALTALAALRGGAGLVQVVCPAEIRSTVTGITPCATTAVFGDADYEQFGATVRAIGPGCRDTLKARQLISLLEDSAVPAVVDADGLNLLAKQPEWWKLTGRHVVLTPHPGEMRRLLAGTDVDPTLARAQLATRLSALCHAVIVLKGHETVVSDSQETYVNDSGNPGMASGGSGDVLTGLIAALLAQGLSPFEAGCLGAHLHGVAGDLAAARHGQISIIATDLIDHLPAAFISHQSS